MRMRFGKFHRSLVALAWVLGIQFLLLPFFHFHPDSSHSHGDQLALHKHSGHFHSMELENIAHLTHDHDSESAPHHSHHPVGQDEDFLEIELNKETLKPQKPFTVLKVAAFFSYDTFHHPPKISPATHRLSQFHQPDFLQEIRDRSPPVLLV
jgi:hypothetical protein|tara:strand:- start:2259 stop:2714 length:456 start_codon:yes stop_codon:yes gene_type:complete